MTYTPPDKVKLLGKETERSGKPADVAWYSRYIIGLECTVVWQAYRRKAVVEILGGPEGGSNEVTIDSPELDTVELAVDWANARVRELLTEALREIGL